eukprot:5427167-Alexandrium_andersonii.AAC.1
MASRKCPSASRSPPQQSGASRSARKISDREIPETFCSCLNLPRAGPREHPGDLSSSADL